MTNYARVTRWWMDTFTIRQLICHSFPLKFILILSKQETNIWDRKQNMVKITIGWCSASARTWSRYCEFPLVVNGRGPYGPQLRKRIFRRNFLAKLDIFQDFSKKLLSAKEKLENNVRFGNQRRNINFHVASFWPCWLNNGHFDFAFSPFCCNYIFYLGLFCDKNKQNNIFKTKNEMFYSLQ